ncbi:hypothetical protein PTTG_00431, partial [Puccinia triticina 1-1 BBBD Race 1]
MPTGDPPPLDPPPGIRSESVQVLSDSIHNPRDAPVANDASPDIVMTSAPEPSRLLETRLPAPPATPATEATRRHSSDPFWPAQKTKPMTEKFEAEQKRMILRTMEEMRQTMQEMKLAMADLRELPGRVTTIEAGQLTRKQPATVKSYASTAATPKAPPPPPTKT